MQVGSLVIAGLFGMVGLVAGRASAPAAPIVVAAAPRVAPIVVVAPTRIVADEVVADVEPTEPTEDEDGTELAVILSNLHDQAASHPDRLAVLGHVTDPVDQPVVGCTVIVTGPNLSGTQTAITDDHGDYRVLDIPAGYYTVTFYYADQTVERTNIASREVEATTLDLVLDPDAHTPRRVYEPPTIDYDGIDPVDTQPSFEGGDDFVRNVPVQGRTFEGVLGAAAGSQDDSEGVSYTGVTSLENTYVIIN